MSQFDQKHTLSVWRANKTRIQSTGMGMPRLLTNSTLQVKPANQVAADETDHSLPGDALTPALTVEMTL